MEESIKQEIEQTLSLRAQRYLKVKPHGIVPYTQFASVSAECNLLFRDGHYYGCITLTQSVAEAIVRFLCQKNSWKPERKNRDDYHHLKHNIEVQRIKLEKISYKKVLLLKEIESEIFKFSIKNGKLIPENKKYWELHKNGTIPIFLKLE